MFFPFTIVWSLSFIVVPYKEKGQIVSISQRVRGSQNSHCVFSCMKMMLERGIHRDSKRKSLVDTRRRRCLSCSFLYHLCHPV